MPSQLFPNHLDMIRHMQKSGYKISIEGCCYGFAQAALFSMLLGEKGIEAFNQRLIMIQETIKFDAALNEKSRHSIQAFYDTIVLFHESFNYPEILSPKQQKPQKIRSLILPTELAARGQLIEIDSLIGCYTPIELASLFEKLERIFKSDTQNGKSIIAFEISTVHHCMSMMYHPYTKKWFCADVNNLPIIRVSSTKLPRFIQKAFKPLHKNIFALDIKIHTLKANPCVNQYDTTSLCEIQENNYKKLYKSTDLLIACMELAAIDGNKKIFENFKQFTHPEQLESLTNQLANVLFIAANKGHDEIIELLCGFYKQPKFLIDLPNLQGATPLFIAAQNNYLNIVNFFLKHKAEVNQLNFTRVPPLLVAAEKGNYNIVFALLQAGAKANLPVRGEGITPLWIAAQNNHQHIIQTLIKYGADINQSDSEGTSPLYIATEKGLIHVVGLLIQHHADLNKANRLKKTPLFVAAEKGDFEIANALINAGAYLNKANHLGNTPLYIAAQNGHKDIVNLLIQAKAYLNKANCEKNTPLHIASINNNPDIVQLLIDAKANLNRQNNFGDTPLFSAAKHNIPYIAHQLVKAGANTKKYDAKGHSLLYLKYHSVKLTVKTAYFPNSTPSSRSGFFTNKLVNKTSQPDKYAQNTATHTKHS